MEEAKDRVDFQPIPTMSIQKVEKRLGKQGAYLYAPFVDDDLLHCYAILIPGHLALPEAFLSAVVALNYRTVRDPSIRR